MDLFVREEIKNEVKATAARRALSKRRAEVLQKKSEKILKELYAEENWKIEDSRYQVGFKRARAASFLLRDQADRARHLHLAYGLLRGVPYRKIEAKARVIPNSAAVLEIISEYEDGWTLEKVEELLK